MNAEIIFRYFPFLTEAQKEQFRVLLPLYAVWNEQINVISRKDMENFYVHHVLHSLGIAKIYNFPAHSTVLDAGTGGGFPGIPLAILFPEVSFILADSIGKKIKVAESVARELKLANVKCVISRVELLPDTFDFITSRAVTNLPDFIKLVRGRLRTRPDGKKYSRIFYLKGGDFDDELGILKRKCTVAPLSSYFSEPYFETKKVVQIEI